MSVRAVKPRRLMLLPIWPPSAAPIVMPGTLRNASEKDVAACDCMTALGTTTTACGMSRNAAGTFAPTLDISGWKSPLESAWPVTRTAGNVAPSTGAVLSAAAAGAVWGVACGAV